MDKSIFIRADELAVELDVSKALAYKMINQWNEELKAKGYTTVGGRVSRQYYYEKIYGAEKEKADGDILFAITGESVDDIAKCCAYIGHAELAVLL